MPGFKTCDYHLAKERRRDEKRNKTRAPEVAERRRQRRARGAESTDLMLLDAAIDRTYAAQTLTGVTKILCSFILLSPTM
jgi:hypothetical protein